MVKFLDLQKINAQYRDELVDACRDVIDSGWYVSGESCRLFEEDFAKYCGVEYCVGVANGLDALVLILRAYKELGRLVDGDEVIVDKPSLDALRGLLLAKKAILQYLLAYDWSVYDEIDEEDAILPYLEKLSIKDGSYILNAKDTLKEAIKLLSQASIEESKLTADYKKSLLYWLTTDEEGNGLDKEEFEGLAQNTLLGILNSVNATVPIPVPNPEDTYTQVVKLSYLFSDPLKGEKIKQDVSSGKIIEVKVCEGGGCFIDANGTKTCYCDDKENDIWFTEDSYLYKYIKTISPDAKLHQRKLNGNIYYTLSDNDYGWNLTSPEVVYPSTE